ncbi:MAG: trypsin-like peptidase domain-containing protein [Negativicutes bacterium]|nr:trypsin-like peptidase domain-containing protein [Negativicutes bacterium]
MAQQNDIPEKTNEPEMNRANAPDVADALSDSAVPVTKEELSQPQNKEDTAPEHAVDFILIGKPIDNDRKDETEMMNQAEPAAFLPPRRAEHNESKPPAVDLSLPKGPYITADRLSRKLKRQIFALVAVCMLVTGALGFGGGYYLSRQNRNASSISLYESSRDHNRDAALTKFNYIQEDGLSQPLSVSQITALAADSVVEIQTEATIENWRSVQYVTTGAGSGVIISEDGYIITNQHVIDGASVIAVSLRNGEAYEASLVGSDSKIDIAILKINATGLTPAVFGDSDQLVVGELAVAIGNPLGQLGGTVTDGIISALDRELEFDNATMNLLQTNAAINPGNSGGGLFNAYGELIGIVNAKSTGTGVEGLGFAIPINDVKAVLGDLMTYGYVRGRIDLHLTLQDVSSYYGIFYGIANPGVYVAGVDTGSNAEKNGIKAGDYLLSIDDTRVNSVAEVNKLLQNYSVGDQINFQIMRNNRTYSGSMILEAYTGE